VGSEEVVIMRTETLPDPADGGPSDRDRRAVLGHLATWEEHSLLTSEQARAIREFEGRPKEPRRRVPPITEVIGYLGAALAVAAGVALVGPRWDEIGHPTRLVGAAGIAALTLVAGWLLRKTTEPAIERLAGVLWTLSVGAVAGFVGLLLLDLPVGRDPADWAGFVVGATVALYAGLLLALRPCAPLQVAMYGGALGTIGGGMAWAAQAGWTWPDANPWLFGVAMLALSGLWIAAGETGRLRPKNAAMLIGSAGAIWAPLFALTWIGFGLLLGVATAVALLAASVWLHRTEMLVLGGLGLFGYLVGAIGHFLADSVGLPIALLLSGLVLLGVAIAMARLRKSAL
jgi:hypothetical protein